MCHTRERQAASGSSPTISPLTHKLLCLLYKKPVSRRKIFTTRAFHSVNIHRPTRRQRIHECVLTGSREMEVGRRLCESDGVRQCSRSSEDRDSLRSKRAKKENAWQNHPKTHMNFYGVIWKAPPLLKPN